MEFHDVAIDISKNENSNKVVAVFTDPENVLGLGSGHVMAPKVAIHNVLDNSKTLDTKVREELEEASDAISNIVDNSAQDTLDRIMNAGDFVVNGAPLGGLGDREAFDLDPHFVDPDSIEMDPDSEEVVELDFD